ncbi:hypothetical protein QJQ45_026525 [Haematococcus lacustris]|nr:hypothetical protein QJQ45_026525 [Haematococcus lacustris]
MSLVAQCLRGSGHWSKRTKAEPAAEPTKGKGKAAKAKPAAQPGRWLDRDCNAALNMQRIGESKWRPLELCWWPQQAALPAKGKEYPGLGYKRLRDNPPKAQQQQPAEAHDVAQHGEDRAKAGRLELSVPQPALSMSSLASATTGAHPRLVCPNTVCVPALFVSPHCFPACQNVDCNWLQVIKVPGGAVLRGCKKTKRKLLAQFQLRAEIHSQLRVIASLFVLRIFLTCLVGYPTPGFRSAATTPAVQPPRAPGLGYKRLRDNTSKAQQQQPAEAQHTTFLTPYNQLQRRLGRARQNKHFILKPAFDDPSNQELLAKLQQLGSTQLTGDHNTRYVKLYAKAARARLGWSGEEAQLFIKLACGYSLNTDSPELQAATLDKGHVNDLIKEAAKQRRLLALEEGDSLQDTVHLSCRMRHAVHVCRCLEQWQQPPTPPVPGQPKRGGRRVGLRVLTCPPPFTLTPLARVGVHFVKVDSRVLHGVCQQLGLTRETEKVFTAEPARSNHWDRWFSTGKLANQGFEFERTVETDGVSVCVHYTRPLPTPPAPPSAAGPSSSNSSPAAAPGAAAVAAHELGLPRIGKGLAEQREFVFNPATQTGVGIEPGVTQAVSAASGVWDPRTGKLLADQLRRWKLTKGQVKHGSGLNNARRDTERWLAPIKPHLQHLAAASSAGTSLEANLKHITVTLATWDAVWEVYLDPKWAEQRLRLYGAQDRALEQFFKKHHGRAKQLVVFFGAATIGTRGGWGADAVLRACCKVVCRPRGTDQRRGRVVLVDEHRTTRVSSAVNGQQPCERQLNKRRATRPAGWKPPAGQVEPRLLRPAWSQQRDQPVRGLVWCPVVAPHKPPQAPRSSQAATPAAASEPGPSTPLPAKRSKRTKAEPGAAEPTKGKGKAAKAKPAPQPGSAEHAAHWGEQVAPPLELCFWPEQGKLPAKGKEYPGLGYKRLRDKPPKAQQQQAAVAQ